ncbi:NAD(P)/FAD-dependent oxidoreductase [Rubritalea spongiae]|uniref:NAD(P)/FAD-dependent oxidoreductase n=1 Tax=Rubritalea spongiae TaxID=430797 RepID=A0ABW5DZ67_9BACT
MARYELVDIILPLERSEDEAARKKAICKKLHVKPERVHEFRLQKHSIDARKAQIKIQMRMEVGIDGPLPEYVKPEPNYTKLGGGEKQIVIVGCGPAGIFAALRCIELGMKPIIVERGKDASARRFDLGPIMKEGRVIEDSNYCFGEGGAGTYSDGKLYTRATKRGPVRDVYETLVAHGAPEQILTDAHPHVGSNLLPNVVKAMRQSILEAGGEVHFESKVVDFILSADNKQMRGVVLADGREITGEAVILATGHSARDIYQLLADKGILMEQKPFAVGMRIEHPQPLIDSIQYSYERGIERPRILPAARYRLATKIDDRGVHSFCMCPGGFIVPAATENDEVVVNGMSLARRDSPFANSGMVVTVEPEDTVQFQKEHGILAGIAYQKDLEIKASKAGGGVQKAPGQRVKDFIAGKLSDTLPKTSYFPGLTSARLDEILPHDVSYRMKIGLKKFGQQMKGYVGEEANLLGFETRTSSPLRIPRKDETLEHPEIEHFIPCGEGAGYAGGIVSAALDGVKCAEAAEAMIRK